jgi:hypothetical protein
MFRTVILCVAFVIAVSGVSFADDAEKIRSLEEKITKLEKAITRLNEENQRLAAENKRLRDDETEAKQKEKPAKPRTLSEILNVDAVVGGDYRFHATSHTGKWALTIVERDGKKFKGSYFVHRDGKKEGDTYDVEGLIGGNGIQFEVVRSAKLQARLSGKLKNQVLTLDYIGGVGNTAMFIAKDVQ